MTRDLSDREVARALGKHPRSIQRWCGAGRLPGAYKAGRSWRIPRSALRAAQVDRALGSGGIERELRAAAVACRELRSDLEGADERRRAALGRGGGASVQSSRACCGRSRTSCGSRAASRGCGLRCAVFAGRGRDLGKHPDDLRPIASRGPLAEPDRPPERGEPADALAPQATRGSSRPRPELAIDLTSARRRGAVAILGRSGARPLGLKRLPARPRALGPSGNSGN